MVLATAAVITEHGADFVLTPVEVPDPGPFDVRVRIRAVGICHTDIAVAGGHRAVPTPIVLGHEGAGIVEAVGAAVTSVAVGHRVALSFASCGACAACDSGHPALCASSLALNFGAQPQPGTPALRSPDGSALYGSFFGQSSFATHALVRADAVARIPDDFPFELAAPLGCSVQTGAGAVWRNTDIRPGDTIVVNGVGAVGLSAVMAAVVSGAEHIIAVDITESRLEVARGVGATRVVDGRTEDLRDVVRRLAPAGADAVIDTTGAPSVIERSLEALRLGGTLAMIASGRGDDSVPLSRLVGKRVVGVLEGDSVPSHSIPQLIALHRSGRFPLEKLVTTYPFDAISTAIADMKTGKAVKPVLVMPD
ncbi:aryl-alcohol dehydrogenase [Glaciihabitans tibetensis]|uniref:Aryl-alcohol dehydrogenase n=1 Tax=Glaciihabitans tibetensis TaxID=1266600 RepID=A0A2T0VDX9_9MICO|nr:NAD(P)-dependent alcohol dehydrogenase [Glaciihabitans tibetensis]PRY68375.1 aryl-alcohol dehydrogenase [Glaciihabitans tibetensis]